MSSDATATVWTHCTAKIQTHSHTHTQASGKTRSASEQQMTISATSHNPFLPAVVSLQHIPLNLKEYCFSDVSQSVTLLTQTHSHTHSKPEMGHTHTHTHR